VVLPVAEACVSCGAILAPANLALQRFKAETADIVAALRRRKAQLPAAAGQALGKAGTYQQLGLASWYDIVTAIPRLPTNVRNKDLQNIGDLEARRGQIRHALGLTAQNPEAIISTLGLTITIGDPLVIKLLNRRDNAHNQLLSVGLATLMHPLEAWEDGDKLRCLRLYRIGEHVATHHVVIDIPCSYISTIYEIDDSASPSGGTRDPVESRTNKKRSGLCRVLAY